MNLLQAGFLGIIQGLSEFLPISSSGHLIIVPYILHWKDFQNNLTFDIALHLGTAVALVAFFWQDWWQIVTGFFRQIFDHERRLFTDPNSRLFLIIIFGSIPAASVGVFFQDFIENTVRQPWVVGLMLIVFALILLRAEQKGLGKKEISQISFKDSLVIGMWQALALIPGVSRSGGTITGGLLQGLTKESAARFSFLLATPAIAGAALLKSKELVKNGLNGDSGIFLVGFIVSALVGWLVIKLLLNYLRKNSFSVFVWYRVGVGLIIIILTLVKY